MTMKRPIAAAAALALIASPALATPKNVGPPTDGKQLIDMADVGVARTPEGPVPTVASVRFIATSSATRFTFAMRADKSISFVGGTHIFTSSILLDNVNLERIDPNTGFVLGGNLFTNGDFEGGVDGQDLPNFWTFDQPEGPFIPASGLVITNPAILPGGLLDNHAFASFADDEYNALSQTIPTIVGATYDIGFTVGFTDNHDLDQNGIDDTDFVRLATFDTDGRQLPNGLDLVLSAHDAGRGSHDDGHEHFDAMPDPVPEPTTWAMLILGAAMTGFAVRRRRQTAAFAA